MHMDNEVEIEKDKFNYNDVDFEEQNRWVIDKWRSCSDTCVFSKEIQTPTNIFRFSTYKDLSSNFKLTAFIQNCDIQLPVNVTFIIINHLNPNYNINSSYRFIFAPFCSNITFEFNVKQKDLIINKGYLDENDSLTIDICLSHKASKIHPKIQPETPQVIGLTSDKSTFHFNNFLSSLLFVPNYKSIVFNTGINSDIPALHFQRLFSLHQFRPNQLYEISTKELVNSLNFTNSDFLNTNFIEFSKIFFEKVEPISHSLFEGSKTLIQKCKKCEFLNKKVETFYGLNISIDGFENLQDALDSYNEQEKKKDVEIDAGEFGLQEAEQFYVYEQLPSILFINLNRFYPDYISSIETDKKEDEIHILKNNSFFAFNQTINLQSLLDNNSIKVSSSNSNTQSKSVIYYLTTVMVHCGTSFEDGHFFCYVRQSVPADFSEWYLFDDNKVLFASPKDAIENNFGGNDQSAYFLIYSKEQLFDNRIEKVPDNIRLFPSMYQQEMSKQLNISEINKSLYKFNIVTPNIVEINASRGKLSFDDSYLHLYIKPKSTLKNLYEKVSNIIHIEEDLILLWIIEDKSYIRNKIEPNEEITVDSIIESGFDDIFVQFLGQETDGDSIFLIFTYFPHLIPVIRLMYTIAQSSESSLNDLLEEYCDITHCKPDYHFTISYRKDDHSLTKINEEDYNMKIKDNPKISSIIVIQPNNISDIYVLLRPINAQIHTENRYSHVINYIDKGKMIFPNTIDEFLEVMSNTKIIMAIKPPQTSKIATVPEISFLLCFPLLISFDDFKFFVVSSFCQNGNIKPSQNFLFFAELSNKPLDFESKNSTTSMEEVFQIVNFEKVYIYNFPFVHFSCMLNTSRLIIILPNSKRTITHFFRDNTPIHKVIELAYREQWINSKEPYNLIYRKKKNGLIKCQVNPLLNASEVKNPLYFCSFSREDCPFDFKDIFIPVEIYKKNENSINCVDSNFLLKVIDEETFDNTLLRIQKICVDLPENCVFKLYNKAYDEVELESESVLSFEKDVILRIYIV